MNLYEAMKTRRSHYNLVNDSPISDERIEEILSDAITYTPSAFHSQSSRVVFLRNEQHQLLWKIVTETLQAIVAKDAFASTQAKMNSFMAAHGTLLFFEDMKTIEKLQQDIPLYADNFPIFSLESAGMLQYAIWTALSSEGLGASLQHYNPLIDEAVHEAFGIDKNWKLLAQMPFGTPNSTVDELTYMPIEERLLVLGK